MFISSHLRHATAPEVHDKNLFIQPNWDRGDENTSRCTMYHHISRPDLEELEIRTIAAAELLFPEPTMPPNQFPQSKAKHQEFPWQGRFYVIRIIFTTMVMVVLAVSDVVCRNQPGDHLWLFAVGAIYPHVGHLLLGRFEGRHRRGYAVLIVDGLFAGAVMAAIGLASAASTVLAAINLFNWMVIGGPILTALGVMAALAGIALSGTPFISIATSPCVASDVLAGIVLIGYLLVVARFIYQHIDGLRKQQLEFQAQSDATNRARKLADRALIAVLPTSVAEVLSDTGGMPSESIHDVTILLLDFARIRGDSPSIADLADCFRTCDAIIARHGFECIKTFGRRYLAISRAKTGPDDAVTAATEVRNFLFDHKAMTSLPQTSQSIRAFVHCGTVTAGLVQPSRLNFDLLGEPMDTIDAMIAHTQVESTDSIVASPVAKRRMQKSKGFVAPAAEVLTSSTYIYRFPQTPLP